MIQQRKLTFRKLYGIALSIMLIAAGLCLIGASLHIYHTGGQEPYSPETVAAAFRIIAIPIYICLALIAGSLLLQLVCPEPRTKAKPEKQLMLILRRHREKADMQLCNQLLQQKIFRQIQRRERNLILCCVLLVLGCAVFLCYALCGRHFHPTDINGSMIRAGLVLFGCLVIPFGFGIFQAYDSKKSILEEIELLKLAPINTAPIRRPDRKETSSPLNIARVVLLCLGVGMVVYGYFAGGTTDVLTKAVNICTECIGLG